MFEKRKLEKVRSALNDIFINEFRFGGSTVASGFKKQDGKYVGAYAKVTKLNKTLLRGLGERGVVEIEYNLDKTLKLTLTFSCSKESDDYEIINRHFYEYEQDSDFEDVDDDRLPYNNLHLATYTDDKLSDAIYTLEHINFKDVDGRARITLDYVTNVYDIYLENLLEEYGEE